MTAISKGTPRNQWLRNPATRREDKSLVAHGKGFASLLKEGANMADETILTTLILDKLTAVSDEPCTSATLIAQYREGYFALTITAEGSLVLGFEGEPPTSIGMRELRDLVKAKQDGMIH